MANYNYRSQFTYSNAAKRVQLLATVNIGSSGAPTLVSTTGMGIASITRSSAGKYVITLSKAFNSLLGLNARFISGTSAPAAPSVNIATNAVSTASAPAITIQCRNVSGTATDPASGEVILIEIDLNESTLSN